MQKINIARAILNGRRAKKVTQEELAQFLGVSKASVSKWETGQSYPDITLLPQIAAYFNISVDELLGYEPWMTKEDIRELYHRLSDKFAELPFTDVMNECKAIIKKYYSCYPLLLQMCVLLINHCHMAGSEDEQNAIKQMVRDLCVKIKNESEDVSVAKQANMLEAICELNLGRPEIVIDLLQDANDPMLGEEVLLASAYYLTGNIEKAKETAQVGIFRHLMGILGDIPNYLMLHMDDPEKFDQIVQRTMGLIELFHVEKVHPMILFAIYLTGAQGYAQLGADDRALELLQKYVDLGTSDIYPLRFIGDQFFDKVHNWYCELDLGVKPPRNEAVIKSDMLEALTKNPVFERLAGNIRFKNMVAKLERKLKGEVK